MVPDPSPPFDVGMSQLVRERIERLSDRARARGISEQFDSAVDYILDLLRMSPRESGDPVRRLRGLNMTQYRIYHERLVADYSVHDRIPMVVLWSLLPGPSHPLAPPPNNGD
jgi:hypothetical protein